MSRKIVTLLCLFCSLIGHAQYTWHELPAAPHSHRHDDMYFLNPMKGWVINPNYNYLSPTQYGQVWTTGDAGATWTKIFDSSTTFIRCIGFADSLHGWFGNLAEPFITPDTNFLYQTSDGGHSWSVVTNITGTRPKGICGISVVTDSVIYAYGRVDRPARIMKTTDKGYSWVSTDMSAYADFLIDGWFFNKDTGFIVGGVDSPSKARVISTYDGGATWQVRYTGARIYETSWKVSFPTRSVGYASVETGVDGYPYSTLPLPDSMNVLKTIDGGLTWNKLLVTPGNYELQGIGFINESVGWVGGDAVDSQTYKTTDGGLSWAKDPTFGVPAPPFNGSNHGYSINRFRRFGDSLMYACGNTVYKLQAGSTGVNNIPQGVSNIAMFPNPVVQGSDVYITGAGSGSISVTVVYMTGKVVANETLTPLNGKYKMSERLQKGMYILTIRNEGSAPVVMKLLVD